MRFAVICGTLAALLVVTGCGTSPTMRAATGGIGGAVVGTVVGGPGIGTGIGAVAGGTAGAATAP